MGWWKAAKVSPGELIINLRAADVLLQENMEEYRVPLPESVRENAPTLAALFGDLDECMCRSCESMLGQPAYLVDLLNLLAKSKGKSGTALEVLRESDARISSTLQLSCEKARNSHPAYRHRAGNTREALRYRSCGRH